MKYADIQKLADDRLISEEQRQGIVARYGLKEDASPMLAIIVGIGATLGALGLILLMAANWSEIPRLVKLGAGFALLAGAYGGGWWLRERSGRYPKTGEALILMGSLLFLGNIALVGQVYHLSSRPPNAFILWLVGIGGLPWLLRSKGQMLLTVIAVCVWFGSEIWSNGGMLHRNDDLALPLFASLGLLINGFGLWLAETRFAGLARVNEKTGLFILQAAMYPLCLRFLRLDEGGPAIGLLFAVLLPAAAITARGLWSATCPLPRQWKWTWFSALLAPFVLVGLRVVLGLDPESRWTDGAAPIHWLTTLVLFVLAMVQMQVGVLLRHRFYVNFGTALIALHVITAYLQLLGSMARTGLMFLVGGLGLMLLGVLLEKRRRTLLRTMSSPSPTIPQS